LGTLPLLTALAVTGASAGGLWLAGAAMAAFLVHEPLLLVLGQRGARRAEKDGARAWRWGSLLAALGALCFVAGMASMQPAARPFLALPLLLGSGVLLLVWGRQERTAAGEVLAALALSAWAVPVALAGGLAVDAALTLWGTFSLSFGLAILAVRLVIRAGKPGANRTRLRLLGVVGVGVTLALAVGLALLFGVPPGRVMALGPSGLAALGCCAVLPSPRRLRTVGWSLAGASLLTAVLLGI